MNWYRVELDSSGHVIGCMQLEQCGAPEDPKVFYVWATFNEELSVAVSAWNAKEGEREEERTQDLKRTLKAYASLGNRSCRVEYEFGPFRRISPWWRFWHTTFEAPESLRRIGRRLDRLGVPYKFEYDKKAGTIAIVARLA